MPKRGANRHLANPGIGAQVRNPTRAAAQRDAASVADGGKSESDLLCAEATKMDMFERQLNWLASEYKRLRASGNRAALKELSLRSGQLNREISLWIERNQ